MGFWSDWMAKWQRRGDTGGEESYIDVTPGPAAGPLKPGPPTEKKSWLARWRPESKRDRQIAWLQAGYSEMLDLSRSIREHLDRQADLQEKTSRVLERLPEAIEGLNSVGKAAEHQVEVLGLLRHQLESSVQHDQQLVDSMNKFNSTLGVMDETARNSGRTVADLVAKSRETESLLENVIERSEKRIAFLIGSFVLVIVLAVGALLYLGSGTRWPFDRILAAKAPPPAAPVVTPPPAPPPPEVDSSKKAAPAKKKAASRRRGFLGIGARRAEPAEKPVPAGPAE